MNKKYIIIGSFIFITLILTLTITHFSKKDSIKNSKTNKLSAIVLSVKNDKLTLQDSNNGIYTFSVKNLKSDVNIGNSVVIEYTGLIDKSKKNQNVSVTNYSIIPVSLDEDGIPSYYGDDGIFSKFYILAMDKLKKMSLDDKIGQLLLVRYPSDSKSVDAIDKYKIGGYVFFAKDFQDKTKDEVKDMINTAQKKSTIPLLTAVDEEGGKVVRISSNPKLASSKFKSSKELYQEGGLELIKEDTKNKSKLLNELGLNVNLAPVVDVSTNSNDYMYDRALGENTQVTSDYAKTVIDASKNTGVSYVMKHFPGYGNNKDTHYTSNTDERSYENILKNDIPPFEAGIKEQAEAILVSHNVVSSIDSSNPASLSTSVHNLLRNNLGFSGIIMTDDLAMGAISSIPNPVLKAILAGNDIIMVTDYERAFNELKNAVNNGNLSEEQINKIVLKILAWKYYKGLMYEVSK